MKTLINDLLAYSRVNTHGMSFELTECEPILNRVLDSLKIPIVENGVLITHDPLPAVMANATQMTQLYQNLIGKAVKFCNNRPPEIHIGAERRDREWLFSIRDTGIGIDPQYFEPIFIIFQRLHTWEKYPGTGYRSCDFQEDCGTPRRTYMGAVGGRKGCNILLYDSSMNYSPVLLLLCLTIS